MVEQDEGLTVKIRGIYATALTQFFLQQGITIVQPSKPVMKRFSKNKNFSLKAQPRLFIWDMGNKHGIIIKGQSSDLEFVHNLLTPTFWDAIYRKVSKDFNEYLEVEFSTISKTILDELRREIKPTIIKHHHFKCINSKLVDLVENVNLCLYPNRWKNIAKDLEYRLIWFGYSPGQELSIEHVKPDGRIISLSEGKILEAYQKEHKLILKRTKYKGRGIYDGLNIPKQSGDYAISTVYEGAWHYGHDYYRTSGEFVGSYININTPIELYPDRIRYVDLEIDVVIWPNGTLEHVDNEKLVSLSKNGFLTSQLLSRAKNETAKASEK